MYYIIITLVLFSLIYFVDSKRVNNFCVSSFKSEIINNFNIFRLCILSFLLSSIFLISVVILESVGFLSINYFDFEFSFLPYIIYTVIVVPVIEEYFYRFCPYSFGKFNNKLVYVIIIIISSLIFTFFHSMNFNHSLVVFFIAIILSLVYLFTNDISITILSHVLYNLGMNLKSYCNYNVMLFYLVIFGIFLMSFVIYSRYFKNKRKL